MTDQFTDNEQIEITSRNALRKPKPANQTRLFSLKSCRKCGQECSTAYNTKLCPDCKAEMGAKPTNRGQEDMVAHFRQDIGLRLQRVDWGHFDG